MLYFSQLQILRPPMFLYVSVTNSTYIYKDKLLQPKISRHQYLHIIYRINSFTVLKLQMLQFCLYFNTAICCRQV